VLRVFDITPDLGIPVAAAVTALSDGSKILMGAACDPDPAAAVQRAVTEACQMLVAMNRIGRVPLKDFPFGKEWLNTAVLDREQHLADSGRTPEASHGGWRQAGMPIAHGIEICFEALQRAGLEAYYVDLTRAELGLRVVRVIVPELRYWVPRLAPGRLYDVQVRMGWLPERLPEDQLNRSPWFL
jgi:ribosomal protein S12 methylthiotransferase accessory factor